MTPEEAAITIAEPLLAQIDPSATISVGVPSNWTPKSKIHVQVAQDSPIAPTVAPTAAYWALCRFTVWAKDTYQAQQVAQNLFLKLLRHNGAPPVSKASVGLGPMPAADDASGAELCSFALNLRVRF